MFNQKKIKELETKVDLILDHLGLEYLPRLVEKEKNKWFETEYNSEIPWTKSKEVLPKGMKSKVCKMCGNTFVVKQNSSRQYCDTCKVKRWEQSTKRYEKRNPYRNRIENKDQVKDQKTRNCKMCGKPVLGSRQFCNECLGKRKRKQQLKWYKKNREKKLKENLL